MTSSNIKGIDTLTDSLGATFNVADIGGGSGGAVDIKDSVLVATTVDGAIATAYEDGDTIDGVVLATGDRILIKNQSSGSENGIYTVNASDDPTRATDADADAEVTQGLVVWVVSGTANAKTGWIITTADPITVDSTAITFEQVAGGGGSDIEVQDEGTPLTTAVTKFNYAGAGVTVTEPIADEMLVTIPGGGDGGIVGISTGWTELDRQTISSPVATVDMASFDPTLYDEIEFSVYSATSVDDTVGISVLVSDDAGVTYEVTGYTWATHRHAVSETSVRGGDDAGTSWQLMGDDIFSGDGTGENTSVKLWLSDPSSSLYKTMHFLLNTASSSGDGDILPFKGGGTFEGNTDPIDSLQFKYSAGNVATGVFVLRGRLKASATIAGFNPDWEVIEEQVVASVADVELGVDTFDPTLYNEIEITIDNLEVVTTGVFSLELSDDNGVTFEGGTGYEWGWHGARSDSTTRLVDQGQGDSTLQIYGFVNDDAAGNDTIRIHGGQMDGGVDKVLSWTYTRWEGAIVAAVTGGGMFDGNTNNIDAFRLSAPTNIVRGKFTLRGRRKNPQTGSVDIDATVQTTDDTETTLVSIPVASNQVIIAHGFGMGYDDSTGDTYTFGFTTTVQNEGGTTTAKGFTIDKLDPDVTGFDVTWDADDSGDVGRLRVTGAVATTVDWKVRYQITRIN